MSHERPSSLTAPQLGDLRIRLASAKAAEREKERSRGAQAGASASVAKQRLLRGLLGDDAQGHAGTEPVITVSGREDRRSRSHERVARAPRARPSKFVEKKRTAAVQQVEHCDSSSDEELDEQKSLARDAKAKRRRRDKGRPRATRRHQSSDGGTSSGSSSAGSLPLFRGSRVRHSSGSKKSRRIAGKTVHEDVMDPQSGAARSSARPPILPKWPKWPPPLSPPSLPVAAGTCALKLVGRSALAPPPPQLTKKASWRVKLRGKIRGRRAAKEASSAASSSHGPVKGVQPAKGKGKGKSKHSKGKLRYQAK